jgi:hypothetical protein
MSDLPQIQSIAGSLNSSVSDFRSNDVSSSRDSDEKYYVVSEGGL